MLRTWLVLVALAGCEGKKHKAVEPAAGSGSSSGSAVAAPAPADAAAAEPPAAGLVPKQLGEKEGVVFAETAGGSVSGIKDGTRVAVASVDEADMSSREESSTTITHEGKNVKLKAPNILLESVMERSADGKYFVFKPITSCGDMCHSELWFVGVDGKRVKLGDAGADVHVAYDPKGASVAIGSGTLWIVSLADFTVKHLENYMSPAYGPDGTLYVRNAGGSAFTLEGEKPKRVWKAPKQKQPDNDEGMEGGVSDPIPVSFDNGKPKYGLD